MRPPLGRLVLAVILVLLALNAWAQVVLTLIGRADDPATLVALQLLVGAAGVAAAVGSWRGRQWAPAAALLYGLATATMIVLLEPILDLGKEARGGLWTGGVAVLVFSFVAAWYLRRHIHRGQLTSSSSLGDRPAEP